jgi:hypothetical protein
MFFLTKSFKKIREKMRVLFLKSVFFLFFNDNTEIGYNCVMKLIPHG